MDQLEGFNPNDYKMGFTPQPNSLTEQYNLDNLIKLQASAQLFQNIKEEPTDQQMIAITHQMSPLSPTPSSGLGSSVGHSPQQQTGLNYFSTNRNHQQSHQSQQKHIQLLTNLNQANSSNNSNGLANLMTGDPILLNETSIIKNEAFSPQSMDICN